MPIDLRIEPALEPLTQSGAGRRRQTVERARGAQRRLKQRTAGGEAGKHMLAPGDRKPAILLDVKAEQMVLRLDQRLGPAVELVAEAALRGGEQQALVGET